MAESRAATRDQHRGIHWQYWYSAWQMLQALAQPHGGVTHIEVEAAGADGVDDVILHFQDRVSACQLKRRQGGLFLGSDLFSSQGKKPALIAKLFTGWKQLVGRHAKVEVRLITNARASDDPANRPIKPEEFIRRIIEPLRAGTPLAKEDETDLAEIRKRAGNPDEAEFRRFLGALHFDFEEADVEVIADECASLLRQIILCARGSGHTESMAFQSWVSHISTRSEARALSVQEVDRALRDVLGLPLPSSEHRIALPEHHIERPKVVDEILTQARRILETSNGGYLRVLGPPGCGKTTLATWIADHHDDEVLVRYHVFDPNRASAAEVEHHASRLIFARNLADVLRSRFPGEVALRIPTPDMVPETMQALATELSRLAEKGARLVIIDGIDHVIRAGIDRDGLLHALPQPPPPGVVFLLFGQPNWKYPDWLGRCPSISVPAFVPEETMRHLCAQLGWTQTDPAAAAVSDQLHQKTEGNPLSIFYNITALRDLGPDPALVAAELPKIRLFGPKPHEEYARLLDDVRQRLPHPRGYETLRDDLLACFAVAIAPLTHARLQAAFADDGFNERDARDFLARLRPVVVELGEGRYRLFHDDFRRFAEEETERINPEGRTQAHQRLAIALEKDWEAEELSAWVDHLWSGGECRRLAELPSTRKLEEWLISSPARSVLDLHRYALAASFRLADENLIFRTSLAAERAWEAAGGATGPTLRDWSFEPPPRGTGYESMRRRIYALRAAASSFGDDPELARAIALRFSTEVQDLKAPESLEYLEAQVEWLLRSGALNAVVDWLARGMAHAVLVRLGRVFSEERRAEQLHSWSQALVGRHRHLDFFISEAAIRHLSDGWEDAAVAIAEHLYSRAGENQEAKRDGYVLLMLTRRTLDVPPCGVVHVPDYYDSDLVAWCDFFSAGFMKVATGTILDLSATALPSDLRERLHPNGQDDSCATLGSIIWRWGCVAGLGARGLLTPRDLKAELSGLLRDRKELDHLYRFAVQRAPDVFAPLLARAIRQDPFLAKTMLTLILPAARASLSQLGGRTKGMLEAIWVLAPDEWRNLAREATAFERLPRSSSEERVQWNSYWSDRLACRGVHPPPEFNLRAMLAPLGVLPKTDPTELVADLLRHGQAATPHQLQRLFDLLIRLKDDPEGYHRDNHPVFLALALDVSPAFFEEEFLRLTVRNSVDEAFGPLPSGIIVEWLKRSPTLSKAELLALWHWLAACSGSFRHPSPDPEIRLRLQALGATDDARRLEDWLAALVEPQGTEPDRFPDPTAEGEVDIEQVELNWFIRRLSRSGERLQRFLDREGVEAWNRLCQRLAFQTASANHEYLSVGEDIAQWLARARSLRLGDSALDVALGHLGARVRFQREPETRGPASAASTSYLHLFVRMLARGLRVSDAEVIRRTLRSLAALARHPATAAQVEEELRLLLVRPDPRVVDMALLVLRQVPKLAAETVALIQTLSNHPDAWCRWFACSILGREPTWDPPRQVVGQPGPLAPGIKPKEGRLGAVYVHDDSTVRENSIQRICALSDLDEEEVRRWLNTEHRDIEPLPDLPSGWHHTNGVHRSNSRVAEAARRLASRLASLAPPAVLPALLGTVAGYDPWRAICEPENAPPRGWIELGVEEQLQEQASEWVTLRSLGLTHREDFAAIGQDLYPRLAHIAAEALFPERPTLFAWVAEPWSEMSAPILRRGPVVPLCFRNRTRPFLRAEFGLVPFWDHPAFNDLTFAVDPVPSWNHPDLGKVVIATVSERPAGGFGPEALPFQSTVGWYAHPQWLTRFGRPELSLIRFWRRASTRQSTNQEAEVEFGLEVVDLPGWPQS
jgi:hypothetical protein